MIFGIRLANAFNAAPPAALVAIGLSVGIPLGKVGSPVVGQFASHDLLEFGGFLRESLFDRHRTSFATRFRRRLPAERPRGRKRRHSGAGRTCPWSASPRPSSSDCSSSSPSGLPCDEKLSCLLGLPYPMCVCTRIRRRPPVFGLRFLNGASDVLCVISVGNAAGVPTVSLETLADVFGEIKISGSRERDMVLIVQIDQLSQAKMPGQRSGFLGYAFHQIAIAANGVCVVVDDFVPRPVVGCGEPGLGNGQSHAVAETLAERSGGHFHTRRFPSLRMAWRLAAPLSEPLEFIEREIVPGEV